MIASANYHNGAHQNLSGSNYIEGVYAQIGTAKYPALFNGSTSSAWPMVSNSNNYLQYVQVGWEYLFDINNNKTMRYFFQANNGSLTDFYNIFSSTGPAQDTTHNYQVVLNGSFGTGTWVGTVDNATISSYPDSQLSWTPPNRVSYHGEVYDYNAAFPGQASDHVNFSNVQYYDGGLGRWTVPNLSRDIDPNYGAVQWTVGNDFTTWDTRY